MDQLDNIELRSEAVQDILTRPPHWLIRWGELVILISVLLLLAMSYFIKYPEFVPGAVTVTSQQPPERLVARSSAQVEKIFVQNDQPVQKDGIIMVLQSSANYQDVLKLRGILDSTTINTLNRFPIRETSSMKLGELQADYNSFAKAFQDQGLFTRLRPYAPDDIAAQQSLTENKLRLNTLREQLTLEKAKFKLEQSNINRSKLLYKEGVISKQDMENDQIKFLQAQQNVQNVVMSISQLQEAITNLNKTKSGVNINIEKDRINYSSQTLQLLEQLRKSLRDWENNYLITASVSGTVSYLKFIGEHQYVQAGEPLLSVVPSVKGALLGRMAVPAVNSGKIETGQKVLIKLDNYPYQEFGIIEGRVKAVSLTPDDEGNYFAEVSIPHGLQTSYGKKLPFDKELRGSAEIVTQDLRLIDRFFYQMRKTLTDRSQNVGNENKTDGKQESK